MENKKARTRFFDAAHEFLTVFGEAERKHNARMLYGIYRRLMNAYKAFASGRVVEDENVEFTFSVIDSLIDKVFADDKVFDRIFAGY